MNDLKLIYQILKILENAMDSDEFDAESISAERLKISENRLKKLLIQLIKNGYVEGIHVVSSLDSITPSVKIEPNATITLKGLEYLSENSAIAKVAHTVKGVADTATHFIP